MALQVGSVERTTETHVTGGLTCHDAGAAKPVEALGRGAGASLQHAPHDLHQLGVPGEHDQDAPQVVAEDAVLTIRGCLQVSDADALCRHHLQATAYQVWLATDQVVEARDLW